MSLIFYFIKKPNIILLTIIKSIFCHYTNIIIYLFFHIHNVAYLDFNKYRSYIFVSDRSSLSVLLKGLFANNSRY